MGITGIMAAAMTSGGTGAAAGSGHGLGNEFVRPMGVPPYGAAPTDATDAAVTTRAGASESASPTWLNLHGGRLDLKA